MFEDYQRSIRFIAEMLHRGRRKAACYSDVVLVAAKLLDSYDPAEYLSEELMRKKVRGVLDEIYLEGRGGQLKLYYKKEE
jgi:hypothetical protein